MTGYIAYREGVTDAYSQQRRVVLMMESIQETIKSVVKSVNYHINKFLSASVWSLGLQELLQQALLGVLSLSVVCFPT